MRYLALATGLAVVGSFAPGAQAATPELPRAGCAYGVEDDADDATADYSPVAGAPVELGASNAALDVTSVTLRLTATELQAFLQVTQPGAAFAAPETGRRYQVTFKHGTKTYVLEHAVFDPAVPESLRPAGTYPAAKANTTALAGAGGGIDPATGYVWVTVPRAAVEADLGAKLVEDDVFDTIAAHTFSYNGTQSWPADDAAEDGTTYVVDGDYCFGPPPAWLPDLAVGRAQYGDGAPVTVLLVDDDGEALAGKRVDFFVNGVAAGGGTSDDDGVVTAPALAKQAAGTYAFVARFAGDDAHGKAKAKGSLVVSPEVTRFGALQVARPTSTTRVVTATLLDDDKHPVTGQRVDFWVNGRKVATVVTDAKGRAVWQGAKPGQRVQARFAVVAGRYAGCASATVTA